MKANIINKKEGNNNEKDKLDIFNEKYHTDLTSEDNILDISKRNLGNEGLQLLIELPLNLNNNVIELNLSENSISDISSLIKMNFNNLKKLNLSKNRISNIIPFEKMNLIELEELDLSNNKLKDINSLSKINLVNLTDLNLGNNQINNIDALEYMKCSNLRGIDLFNNEILDITVFERINFPQLIQISFAGNYFNHELIKNHDIISNLRKKGCNVSIWGTIKQILFD